MKALRQVAFGRPTEVLSLVDMETPDPGEGEVLCRVLASPLNPADLLSVRGFYPIKPQLPWIPGIEGVGQVVALGRGVQSMKRGQIVLLPIRAGLWAEMAVAQAKDCVGLPSDICPTQVSMLRINALTARVMLKEFYSLSKGDWLIQNPGSSSVAQYIVQLANREGIRTCSIIRRPERAAHMKALGSSATLLDGPDLKERVRDATGGASISLALDATGGEATNRMASCLCDDGLVVSYGAVSRKPAQIGVMHSVFRGVRLQGFWLYPWKQRNPERTRVYLNRLAEDFRVGHLSTEVAGEFGLEKWNEAFALARQNVRDGRVVLCPSTRV